MREEAKNFPCSVLIRKIYLAWAQNADDFLAGVSEDLSLTQANTVAALWEAEGFTLSLKELEHAMGTGQSVTVRNVFHLADAGYVEEIADETDRRVKRVRLKEKGILCGKRMAELLSQGEEQLLTGLSPGERLLFEELLEKALENSILANKKPAAKPKKPKKQKKEGEKQDEICEG